MVGMWGKEDHSLNQLGKLALPKALGGWGLKNIFLFSKALDLKAGWCLIKNPIIWSSIVLHKYLVHHSRFIGILDSVPC
jgi:hypothetical protein